MPSTIPTRPPTEPPTQAPTQALTQALTEALTEPPTETPTEALAETHAVVVGASLAGLVAARVLSDHVDHVTILERDDLPASARTRRSVPQGRHAHALLSTGQRQLEQWFPGLGEQLIVQGAVPLHAKNLSWYQAGAHRARSGIGFLAMSMSRPMLEGTVRQCLLHQRRNVTITDGVAVGGPIVEDGRVVGVVAGDVAMRADLVVDCTGRRTRFFDLLDEAGFASPEVSAIRIAMAHGTRVLRRGADDLDGTAAVIVEDPTRGHRIGTLLPIEGDRWILTVAGFHGDVPPSDPTGFAAFVRALPSSELGEVLDGAEALTPVLTHRLPTSQRRHVERLANAPAGFLALGDAICSFNPVYGQGMTSAALQARELERALARHVVSSSRLPRVFYRRAAAVVDAPWAIAAGGDFADPRTTGSKPTGTDLANRWLELVTRASHTSRPVADQLLRVQNLEARPASLLGPVTALRVLLTAHRSPAARRRSSRRSASRSVSHSPPGGSSPARRASALVAHPAAAGAHPGVVSR